MLPQASDQANGGVQQESIISIGVVQCRSSHEGSKQTQEQFVTVTLCKCKINTTVCS